MVKLWILIAIMISIISCNEGSNTQSDETAPQSDATTFPPQLPAQHLDETNQRQLGVSWNLVSLPIEGIADISDVLFENEDFSQAVVSVWGYEGSDDEQGGWSVFPPVAGYDELSTISPDKGYWVRLRSEIELTGDGVTEPAHDFIAGWNLVGYSHSLEPIGVHDYFEQNDFWEDSCGEGDTVMSVWSWQDGTWSVYFDGDAADSQPELDEFNTTNGTSFTFLEELEPGVGMWVYAARDNEPPAVGGCDPNETSDLPEGIVMKPIPGGSFTMGDNELMGPAQGEATEHTVTLSDFEMSEAEITNAQYVEFLNAAYEDGLVEIVVGTAGADLDKKVIVGSSLSDYEGKVLYTLDGTRVMKDHVEDEETDDGNAFTGVIEPENPLNIAYIGFDETTEQFYVKDPHSLDDFNWLTICDYFDYGDTQGTYDTTPKNDFDDWEQLAGWTAENPAGATNLHTQEEVMEYPVTFIRWWGAKAFADYYEVKLPSEAQWEYAAKGGADFTYAVYDGETVSNANWNQDELHPALHHVRAAISGNPNPYGLYNLGGNVWEWMADNYESYSADAVTDPVVENGSSLRSWRGGSWNYHLATLETTARYSDEEDRGNDHFGFRIVR